MNGVTPEAAGLKREDAWVESTPILAAAFGFRGRSVSLHFSAPRRPEGAVEIGAIIGCLHVRAAPGAGLSGKSLAAFLRAVARKTLPGPEIWRGEPWFDAEVAALFRSAGERFGERLWPGLGVIAGWRTLSVTLSSIPELRFELRHGPGRARLGLRQGEAVLTLVSGAPGADPPTRATRRLLAGVGRLLHRPPEAPSPRQPRPGSMGGLLCLVKTPGIRRWTA